MKALDGSENLSFTDRAAQVTWGLTVPEMSLISPALSPRYIHLLHKRVGCLFCGDTHAVRAMGVGMAGSG